jgi:hypothetical protein
VTRALWRWLITLLILASWAAVVGCDREERHRCAEGLGLSWQREMVTARQLHSATLMRGGALDGCVVVVGGLDVAREPVADIEIFDPARNAWARLAQRGARVFHTATWIEHADPAYLLVVGGYDSDHVPMGEAMTITNDGVIGAVPEVFARAEHSATVLGDERVLVVGGGPAQSQIFDPAQAQDQWSSGPLLSETIADVSSRILAGQVYGHAALRVDNADVMLAGGAPQPYYASGAATPQDDLQLDNTWLCNTDSSCEAGPSMASHRGARVHTLAMLNLGGAATVLVLGGGSTERWDAMSADWSRAEGIPDMLPKQAATASSTERIAVLGGVRLDVQDSTTRVEVVNLNRQSVRQDDDEVRPMTIGRYAHSATLLEDGRVLVAGGIEKPSSPVPAVASWEVLSLDGSEPVVSSQLPSSADRQSPLSCAVSSLGRCATPFGAISAGLLLICLLARRTLTRRSTRTFATLLPVLAACGVDATQIEPISVTGESVVGATAPDAGATSIRLDVTWTPLSTDAVKPSPRVLSALAIDPEAAQAVLFGGASRNGGLGDTWLWNLRGNSSWTEHTGDGPPVRANHSMVYSAEAGAIILFGGVGAAPLGDLWSWSASRWETLCTEGCAGPAARHGHAMVYDVARGNLVLFGGHDGSATLADTWTWTRRDGWVAACTPEHDSDCEAPPARYLHALLFDPASGHVVLYGGRNSAESSPDGSEILNDTWRWDGSRWRDDTVQDRLNGLGAHSAHSFGWDSAQQVWVTVGGINADKRPIGPVWGYSDLEDKRWVRGTPLSMPPASRAFASMAWDPISQRFLVFGGGFSAHFDDLWSLQVEYSSPRRDCLRACEFCPSSCPGTSVDGDAGTPDASATPAESP